MAASRHEVLTKTTQYVDAAIAEMSRDLNPEECCTKAFEDLGRLVKESRTLPAGTDVPSVFADGIQAVVSRLDALRTGFARTYEQENGGVTKSDAWAQWRDEGVLKPVMKDMSVAEFVAFAKSTVEAAVKCAERGYIGRGLEALRLLKADILKAESFEDNVASTISVTVENDPMKLVQTEAPGTTAPAGTSRPDTAASNYVTNPTGVTAGPPDTGKNPATASAEAAQSNSPAGTSNFVAAGGGNGVAKAVDAEVAKAVEDECVTKALADMGEVVRKGSSDRRYEQVGWAADLSSPEFLHGKTRW